MRRKRAEQTDGSTTASTTDGPAEGPHKGTHEPDGNDKKRLGRQTRPEKPYPEFPLTPHPAGVWAKKIRGKLHYFGPWHDPQAALERYLAVRDHLLAGLAPPPAADAVTLDELVNRFLAAKRRQADLGEIGPRQYLDYKRDGGRLLACLGRQRPAATLRPGDFATLRAFVLSAREGQRQLPRNATTVHNIITRMRTVFRWGKENGLLDAEPDYGGQFSRPRAAALRRARYERGALDLSPQEVRTVLDAAARMRHVNLRAMILLAINAALGNTDCGELRLENLDLEAGRLVFPRVKTAAPRRAVLWPETVAALREVLAWRQRYVERPPRRRPQAVLPADLADRVFITEKRRPYVHLSRSGKPVDSVGMQFCRLLRDCGLHRPGLGFYSLRRTFRTIADETRDFPAIDLVMGHLAADAAGSPFAVEMGDRYRQRIGDDRLHAIAGHVRAWLFGRPAAGKGKAKRRPGRAVR